MAGRRESSSSKRGPRCQRPYSCHGTKLGSVPTHPTRSRRATPSRPTALPRRGAASVCSLHSARSCARLTSGRYRRTFHGFRRIRTGSCPKISSPRSFFPLAESSSTSATAPLCPAIDGSKQAHETIDCQRADLNPNTCPVTVGRKSLSGHLFIVWGVLPSIWSRYSAPHDSAHRRGYRSLAVALDT